MTELERAGISAYYEYGMINHPPKSVPEFLDGPLIDTGDYNHGTIVVVLFFVFVKVLGVLILGRF